MIGKYAFDFDSIDMDKLDIKRIKSLLEKFPQKTRMVTQKLCKI